MAARRSKPDEELYRRRLTLATYPVKDAARYADVTPQTVRNWQRVTRTAGGAIAHREPREALSYLQLQELAVVSAMRKLGVALKKIRLARDFLSQRLSQEFPFSDRRVCSDGQDILMQFEDELGGDVKLIIANRGGQYVWMDLLGQKFDEFEYVGDIALRWKVAGKASPIVIDPRISFGAPAVKGIPTWTLRGRWTAGENLQEIADDFELTVPEVRNALAFEGVDVEKRAHAAA